jgi:pyruvate dehydrogenase E2 component (dihydrolipoamide acetyltransferase)
VQRVDVTRIATPGATRRPISRHARTSNSRTSRFYEKATVEALRAVPQLNASINAEPEEVTNHGHVHLAIAVDGPQGLLVPVIKDV